MGMARKCIIELQQLIKQMLTVPFFLIISIDGLIKCVVASEMPIKQYIIPR
jgi:hypothetical protein